MRWIDALIRVLVANLVPLWGYTQADWSAGTTLALFWFQTLIGIAITASLIIVHRGATRKAGHYRDVMTIQDSRGNRVTKPSTFLAGFLLMSVPFTLAHGSFLAVLLGLIWKNVQGAVDFGDLRVGIQAAAAVAVVGLVFEIPGIARRSFAWMQFRAGTVLQRTLVIHLVIIFGLAIAALTGRDSAAFFGVFFALKLAMDVLGELPQWNPEEAPKWLVKLLNRLGDGKEDFAEVYKRQRLAERESAAAAELPMDASELAARHR